MGEVYGDITAIRYEYFTVDPGTFKGGCPDSVLESSHLPWKRRMVLDRIMCAHPYDFIILDPPAFAKHHKVLGNAMQGYTAVQLYHQSAV